MEGRQSALYKPIASTKLNEFVKKIDKACKPFRSTKSPNRENSPEDKSRKTTPQKCKVSSKEDRAAVAPAFEDVLNSGKMKSIRNSLYVASSGRLVDPAKSRDFGGKVEPRKPSNRKFDDKNYPNVFKLVDVYHRTTSVKEDIDMSLQHESKQDRCYSMSKSKQSLDKSCLLEHRKVCSSIQKRTTEDSKVLKLLQVHRSSTDACIDQEELLNLRRIVSQNNNEIQSLRSNLLVLKEQNTSLINENSNLSKALQQVTIDYTQAVERIQLLRQGLEIKNKELSNLNSTLSSYKRNLTKHFIPKFREGVLDTLNANFQPIMEVSIEEDISDCDFAIIDSSNVFDRISYRARQGILENEVKLMATSGKDTIKSITISYLLEKLGIDCKERNLSAEMSLINQKLSNLSSVDTKSELPYRLGSQTDLLEKDLLKSIKAVRSPGATTSIRKANKLQIQVGTLKEDKKEVSKVDKKLSKLSLLIPPKLCFTTNQHQSGDFDSHSSKLNSDEQGYYTQDLSPTENLSQYFARKSITNQSTLSVSSKKAQKHELGLRSKKQSTPTMADASNLKNDLQCISRLISPCDELVQFLVSLIAKKIEELEYYKDISVSREVRRKQLNAKLKEVTARLQESEELLQMYRQLLDLSIIEGKVVHIQNVFTQNVNNTLFMQSTNNAMQVIVPAGTVVPSSSEGCLPTTLAEMPASNDPLMTVSEAAVVDIENSPSDSNDFSQYSGFYCHREYKNNDMLGQLNGANASLETQQLQLADGSPQLNDSSLQEEFTGQIQALVRSDKKRTVGRTRQRSAPRRPSQDEPNAVTSMNQQYVGEFELGDFAAVDSMATIYSS